MFFNLNPESAAEGAQLSLTYHRWDMMSCSNSYAPCVQFKKMQHKCRQEVGGCTTAVCEPGV